MPQPAFAALAAPQAFDPERLPAIKVNKGFKLPAAV
jgi:hypothetical protein